MWRAVTRERIPERTRQQHEALVVAIETGDRDLAFATAQAHIAGAQAWIARAEVSEVDQ
jgi:DNA-binding FadR family transcriptional regulator